MRILYITHLFPPRYFAGTESLTYDLAQQMRSRGHAVEVATCEDFKSGSPQVRSVEDDYEGLRVHRIALDTRFAANPVRAQYFYAPLAEVLRLLYRSFRPDLVHVHHFGYLSTATATAAFDEGIPVVFTPTDYWALCPTSQLLRHDLTLCNGPTNVAKCLKCYSAVFQRARPYQRLFETVPEPLTRWAVRALAPALARVFWPARAVHEVAERAAWNLGILRRLARILAPTHFLLERFVENGVPRELLVHLPYGLNLARLGQVERHRPSSPLQVGFVGAIDRHKGTHVLVEAFRRLGREAPAELRIYGNPEHNPDYTREVQVLAAQDTRIRFCGTFPPSEFGRVLAELDVLVIPSIWYENLPLVLLSALAARLPVIVSDMPGLAEVVRHSENGLVVPANDPAALASALERCWREPELLPRLARQAPQVKSLETYADEVLGVYEAVKG